MYPLRHEVVTTTLYLTTSIIRFQLKTHILFKEACYVQAND